MLFSGVAQKFMRKSMALQFAPFCRWGPFSGKVGQVMTFKLRLALALATVMTIPLFAQPAQASSCGFLCSANTGYIHTNTDSGYISYLATDFPAGWPVWPASSALFTTVIGTNGVAVGDHAPGVWYNGRFGGNRGWTVFNEDLSPVTAQAQYYVNSAAPYQLSSSAVYTHVATASNSAGDYTLLDNPVLNGNPNAYVVVSAAYISDHTIYDTHALGVWYDSVAGQWGIFHEDQSAIPNNAAYFVGAANAPGNLTITASSSNMLFGKVMIDNPNFNNHSSLAILLTQVWTYVYNPHNVGIEYLGGHWFIYNLDGSNILAGATFMVYNP